MQSGMETYAKRCATHRQTSGIGFEGELMLFIVDVACRGQGIGSVLYSKAVQYLRTQNCRRFFLYTDSSCTWRFYEGKHLRRIGSDQMAKPGESDQTIQLYLYAGELQHFKNFGGT